MRKESKYNTEESIKVEGKKLTKKDKNRKNEARSLRGRDDTLSQCQQVNYLLHNS